MNQNHPELSRFVRRIRILNTWRGLSIGTLVGCLAVLVLAILDALRVTYSHLPTLLFVILGGLVAGGIAGIFIPISEKAVAISIDRRAKLKDRLTTTLGDIQASSFRDAQVENAKMSLVDLRPSALFPVKFGPFQFAALIGIVVSVGMFLLGNSPVMRGPKSEAEKTELKEAGQKVERVARPLEKPAKTLFVPQSQKQLGAEMNRFAKELQEGKLNKEEAMRKANDIASAAEKESKTRADEAQKKTEEAETALGKFQKMKLDESGINAEDLEKTNLSEEEQASLDKIIEDNGFQNTKSKFSSEERKASGISETAEKISQLSKSQQDQLRADVSKRQEALQKEIDRIDKLPAAERKKLEQQRQELQKQQQQMQKIAESLKLSEETKKALKELMESVDMQKIRESLEKMKQQSQNLQQGQAPSKEEIEKLKQQIEQLEQAMKDPQLREQVMQQMKEALKQLESGQMSAQAMQQMMTAMGMNNNGGESDPNGDPGGSDSGQFADTGKINKSGKEMETKGKGLPTNVKGKWDDSKGEQWSVTVKAPTQVGNRTTVPYRSVLPKYQKSAEKALSSGKIPKEKEKRVRDYFDTLNGGK